MPGGTVLSRFTTAAGPVAPVPWRTVRRGQTRLRGPLAAQAALPAGGRAGKG